MGGICGFSFCYQVSDSCCMRTVLETRLDLAMIPSYSVDSINEQVKCYIR